MERGFLAMKSMMQYDQNNGYSKAPVLVVDDNTFNTVAIQNLLMQFKVESDSAVDGNQAIHWVKQRFNFQRSAYKLILLDYSMPECDGVEAALKIKQFMNEVLPKSE